MKGRKCQKNDNAPAQTVNPGLDENEPELGVLVLPVPLQMLADGDGLLDEEVHVLGQVGGQSLRLQDAEDLVASDEANLNVGQAMKSTLKD